MSEIPDTAKQPQDHRIKLEGKFFHWTTEEGATLTIPLRIKMRVVRSMSGKELDADTMFEMIEAIAPDQTSVIDEMDTNDFIEAFTAWQTAYNAGQGVSLGEQSGSSPSSTSIEQPSSTTGDPAST